MGDILYFSGIVKVLEDPIQTFLDNKILVTTFRVEISQIQANKIIVLAFWGNSAWKVKNGYQPDDYLLVEGYPSIRNKDSLNFIPNHSNDLVISVLKVYPFLLKSNSNISKM